MQFSLFVHRPWQKRFLRVNARANATYIPNAETINFSSMITASVAGNCYPIACLLSVVNIAVANLRHIDGPDADLARDELLVHCLAKDER